MSETKGLVKKIGKECEYYLNDGVVCGYIYSADDLYLTECKCLALDGVCEYESKYKGIPEVTKYEFGN